VSTTDEPRTGPADQVAAVRRVAAHERRARVAASTAYFVQGLCFAGVLTQVPALKDRFNFSDLQLSLILFAVPVVAGVGSTLAGALAPRTGSAIILRLAGLGVSTAVALIGLSSTRPLLYASVGLFGLVIGMVDATMNMQGVAIQRRYGRSIIASCHAWWSVGGIVASLGTSETARLDWSLGRSMGAVGLLGGGLVLAAGPFLLAGGILSAPDPLPGSSGTAAPAHAGAQDRAGADGAAAVGGGRAGRRWALATIGLAVMIMYIGESSTSNWSALFIRDALHASRAVAPLGLAVYLACQLIGRTMADRVIGAIGAARTIVVGAVVAVAGFALVVVATAVTVAVAGFALVGVGLCVVVPLAFSAADALDPAGSGVAIARVNVYNYAGFVVGAALIGVVASSAGLRFAFGVPGVMVLAMAALAPAFRVVDGARHALTDR
jgi:predicted MFS family arabinose efflux permease